MKSAITVLVIIIAASAAFAGTARPLYSEEKKVVAQEIAQLTGSNKAKLSLCYLTAEPFTVTCEISMTKAGDQDEPAEFKGEAIFNVTVFKDHRIKKVSIKSVNEYADLLHARKK